MNKYIIKSIAAIVPALALMSCAENAWNDEYLDGFQGGQQYNKVSKADYTLTSNDYATISNILSQIAETDEEKAAATAIKNNLYFDMSSPYPASVAIPYYLSSTSSQFFNFNDGSTVNVTYQQVMGTPEELKQISASDTYTLTANDYKKVWGSETDYVSSFSPSKAPESYIPNILKEQYPDAVEGDYAIVTYNIANENPAFGEMGGGSSVEITSNIKNIKSGDMLNAVAVVTAQCSRGLILSDNGGSILYYNTSVDLSEYPIGTIVKVSGEVGAYNTGLQLTNTATLTKVGSEEYVYPTPVNYTGAMIDSACTRTDNSLAVYMTLDGEISISGTYYNIAVDGATAQGSIYWIADDMKNDVVDGESYRFYGYFIAVSGSATKFFNFVMTEAIPLSEVGDDTPGTTPGSTEITDNIKNITKGQTLTATAVVTAQCSRGLILTDKGGSILYYNTGINLNTYPIGTIVNVSGKVTSYNQAFELDDSATINVAGSESYTYPTPTAYTASMVEDACIRTADMLATYVSIQGTVSVSGSYYNIDIEGCSNQGSVYYATDAMKAKLVDGQYSTIYGYFMAVSGSARYFNIVVTDVVPATKGYFGVSYNQPSSRSVAFAPANKVENAAYYFDGSAWVPAESVAVLDPSDYEEMGDSNNAVSSPNVKIPLYLKANYPYAVEGDQKYVAYNITSSGCSCGLFVYNGSSWALNDNGRYEGTGIFEKKNKVWSFTRELGKAVFTLFNEDEIELDRAYMIAYGTAAATPVQLSYSYGYLLKTEVNPSDGQIVMNDDSNKFTFKTTCTIGGVEYEAPEGTFMICDSNNRYLYLKGTYSSFNLNADEPELEDGVIAEGYIFTATNNGDGSWSITNDRGEGNVRNIYFSSSYNNFAAYTSQGANDYFPSLYILD